MNIEVKHNWAGTTLEVKAENVCIKEDISEFTYSKKENGKPDFSKREGLDITNDYMKQILQVAEDVVYYRKAEFDSTSLIEILFAKYPDDKVQELLKKLNDTYLI